MAGGKFGNDVLDNVPLARARVLRLIDQDVVDAAVELVMHPARRHLGQHGKRLVDQIVIIEQAALLLFAPVVCCRCYCDMQQGLGAIAGNKSAASFDQGRETKAFLLEQMSNRLMIIAKFLSQNRLTRHSFISQEYTEIFVDLRGAGGMKSLAQPSALIGIGLAAAIECARDLEPPRPREIRAVDDFALDVFEAVVLAHAKHDRHLRGSGLCTAGSVGPGHEMVAAETSFANDILEGDVGSVRHRGLKRAAEDAVRGVRGFQKYPEVGALHHVGLVAFVEHGKTRRYVGLERELLQKSCT